VGKIKMGVQMNAANDGSELVSEVGPLAIFRSSSLEYGEKRGDLPYIRPCYTVAVNPNWLDDGGEIELCIAGSVRIVGTDAPLADDSLVQIINRDGQHHVMVLNEDHQHEDRLQLEPMPENAKAN
jgi:hypothetical protein